ncbi:hypothetical protein O181_057464 [Austropuccinia psidii MF-1]|uniref:Integrase catalytic domain-containing protein n=1 Tax=Austropuccinia psidii MF-1 TaxID=1389203 RepID=A0A9Q3HWP8_9BASI|nr:hypothetical protein [Austropuccinia psidii MF-1]
MGNNEQGLFPGGKKNLKAFLVIVYISRKISIFIPFHKEDTALEKALLFWNNIIETCGVPKIIKSDGDPKFTLEFWTNLYEILDKNPKFTTDYHPHTAGLGQRMIQKLEDIISVCAYGMEYKDH